MAAAAAAAAPDTVNAEAFRRLYPEEYWAKFIAQSVRPDGRPLGRARPTSVGLGAVSSADASALVKIGAATVLAGAKCEVMAAADDAPDQGRVAVQVELSPLCSATTRPGRPSEAALVLTDQMAAALESSQLVDLKQLCIYPGRAAWIVYVDLYVLDADGSLHDACLLALVAALATLRLPAAVMDEDTGNVVAPTAAGGQAQGQQQQQQQPGAQARQLALGALPVSLTCGLYGERTIVDLTAEEEALVEATVVTTVDPEGAVLGMLKPGGAAGLTLDRLQDCIEAAKRRHAEVSSILERALAEYNAQQQ